MTFERALHGALTDTAFHGFGFSREQAGAIDALLAESERIAFTLTAPSHGAH